MIYVHLAAEGPLPEVVERAPCKSVIVPERPVSGEYREAVSRWLLETGCRYVMAWGTQCEQWHDAVDMVNIELFDFGDIPDDRFVMTTWHADETLDDVFWFARHCANHPTVELKTTLIIHISDAPREQELIAACEPA